jgi:hypothetical protein
VTTSSCRVAASPLQIAQGARDVVSPISCHLHIGDVTKSGKGYPNRVEGLPELGEGAGGEFACKFAIQFGRGARRVPKEPLAGRGENQDLPATVPGIAFTIERAEALHIVGQANNEARGDPQFAGDFGL